MNQKIINCFGWMDFRVLADSNSRCSTNFYEDGDECKGLYILFLEITCSGTDRM